MGELSKKISSAATGAFKRIRPYISERTALQICQALILPHFDYCNSVWGDCNLTFSDKLQKLQNRAFREITRSSYGTSASFLLNVLNWDDLITRRQKLKAILMFKTIKVLTSTNFQNLFSTRSTQYNLRETQRLNLSCLCRAQITASVLLQQSTVMEQIAHQIAKIRLLRIF